MQEQAVKKVKLAVAAGVAGYVVVTAVAFTVLKYFAFPLFILFILISAAAWIILGGSIAWETVHRYRNGEPPVLSELLTLVIVVLLMGYSLFTETTVASYQVTAVTVQWAGAVLLPAVVLVRYGGRHFHEYLSEKYGA